MWNRRKEDDFVPKPASVPPTQSQLAQEGIPMSTLSGRSLDSSPQQSGSSRSANIGKSVTIKGQILSREDLTIDGEVEGTVEAQENRLTVGPNGKVVAGIKAREIVVFGTIHGNVETTDKIDIRKDAKLIGDIKTARIVIEDGAYFKGNIDITKPEVVRPAAAAAAPKPQPVTTTPASTTPSTPHVATAAAGSANDVKR